MNSALKFLLLLTLSLTQAGDPWIVNVDTDCGSYMASVQEAYNQIIGVRNGSIVTFTIPDSSLHYFDLYFHCGFDLNGNPVEVCLDQCVDTDCTPFYTGSTAHLDFTHVSNGDIQYYVSLIGGIGQTFDLVMTPNPLTDDCNITASFEQGPPNQPLTCSSSHRQFDIKVCPVIKPIPIVLKGNGFVTVDLNCGGSKILVKDSYGGVGTSDANGMMTYEYSKGNDLNLVFRCDMSGPDVGADCLARCETPSICTQDLAATTNYGSSAYFEFQDTNVGIVTVSNSHFRTFDIVVTPQGENCPPFYFQSEDTSLFNGIHGSCEESYNNYTVTVCPAVYPPA